jgi:hypothetical protein
VWRICFEKSVPAIRIADRRGASWQRRTARLAELSSS